MKATHLVFLSLAAAAAAAVPGAPAHADPGAFNPNAFDLSGAIDREVAPTRAPIELAVGGGYTQGMGGAGTAGSVEDLAGAGGGVEIQAGLRKSPRFSLGVYSTLARFRHGDVSGEGSHAYAATAGVQAVLHSRQSRAVDPWVSLGAGWRGLWLSSPGASSALHGLEVARLQLGIDYRITPSFAIAPVVGASASVFLVEDGSTTDVMRVTDNRFSLYGFTGVQGRFDLGG